MKNNSGQGELAINSSRTSSNRAADFDALSDRIANALEATSTSEKLSAHIGESETTLIQLRGDCARAREIALDPLTRSSEGVGVRADVFDLEFKIERLEVALARLKEKCELALSHEREAAERVKRAEGEAKRDALATKFKEVYPRAAAEIASLFAEIVACDRENQALGIPRVEALAREIPPHGLIKGTTLVGFLTETVRLASFDPEESVMQKILWPQPQTLPNANIGAVLGGLTPEMIAHSAALGNEGRRIGEEVARNRRRERRASMPSPLHQFVPVLDPDKAENVRDPSKSESESERRSESESESVA